METAESAWRAALVAHDQDDLRRLMRPDCLVVHGAAGHVDGPEEFLRAAHRVGRVVEVAVYDTVIRRIADVAVVTCVQDSRIEFVDGLTPFTIQAAVTRVWAAADEEWRLVHMQMARRHPPG